MGSDNSKMKVLMLGPDRSVHGGISGVVNTLYEAGIEDKVDISYIGTMKEGSKLLKLWIAAKAYLRFCSVVKKYDIVHVNFSSDMSYLRKSFFIKKAQKENKKIVIHQHGGDIVDYYESLPTDQKERMRSVFDSAEVILALSEQSKAFLSTLTDEDKIVVLANSVRVPEVINKIPHEGLRLIYLGRICKDKGINELVEVFIRLHQEYPDIKLSIGGIFEDVELKDVILKTEGIEFKGWVDGKKKHDLLLESDILVLPSYYEGMPMCVLDGMAYGLGVVSTAVGGVPEVVDNMKSGILVNARDKDSLYEGIKKLITDEQLRLLVGKNGRDIIVRDYSSESQLKKLINIYESL